MLQNGKVSISKTYKSIVRQTVILVTPDMSFTITYSDISSDSDSMKFSWAPSFVLSDTEVKGRILFYKHSPSQAVIFSILG
jgi:hypothetical protein